MFTCINKIWARDIFVIHSVFRSFSRTIASLIDVHRISARYSEQHSHLPIYFLQWDVQQRCITSRKGKLKWERDDNTENASVYVSEEWTTLVNKISEDSKHQIKPSQCLVCPPVCSRSQTNGNVCSVIHNSRSNTSPPQCADQRGCVAVWSC